MKYFNPLTLLQNPDQPDSLQVDRKHLQLQKKKLLAEIELSADRTVVLNGAVFNKNDVLNLFDRLQNSDELEFHSAIQADAELSFFLEYGEFTHHGHFAENELYETRPFIEFISPYYEQLFTRGVLNAFKSNDLGFMETLWENPLMITGDDREKSFGRINRFLYERKNQLLAAKQNALETRTVEKRDFEPYINSDFIGMLNLLPPEFMPFMDDYALDLINTGVDLQHIKLKVAVDILFQTRSLQCDDYMQQQNEERYQIMRSNLDRKTGVGGSGFSWFHLIWILFVVIKGAASFDSCGSKTTPDWSNVNVTYGPPPEIIRDEENDPAFNGERYDAVMHMTTEIAYYHENPSPAFDPRPAALNNGDNVYQKQFSYYTFTPASEIPPVQEYISDANKHKGAGIQSTAPPDKRNLYLERIVLENHTSLDAIAIVQTIDSLYSCFVKAKSSASFLARDGKNRVYFYLGKEFNKHNYLTLFVPQENGVKRTVKMNGLFNNTPREAIKLLGAPYIITVDQSIRSQKSHQNWFEIDYKNGEPKVTFLSNGFGKVKETMTYH